MRIKQILCSVCSTIICLALSIGNLLLSSDYAKAQTHIKYGTAEVQKGKIESFFSDWDLCTDNSNNTALDKKALKKGQSYFYGIMDQYGRITELRYYDPNWVHRWTKRFHYSSNGQHTYQYLAPSSRRINHKRQEIIVKKHSDFLQGTRKEEIRRILGEPLIVQIDSFGMEKWRYYDGVLQHWYTFNAKGELDYSNYRE
jgi:hypothetical protein